MIGRKMRLPVPGAVAVDWGAIGHFFARAGHVAGAPCLERSFFARVAAFSLLGLRCRT